MLEICNLTKRYKGVVAVENVSFRIRPGEILGYIGPNGAGKSTTVKMIMGLLDPSDGYILFQGRSVIDDLSGFQRRLGYVPEEPNLYPYLSGWEYLRLAGKLRGMREAALDPKIDEFLQLFSLWDDRHCPLSSYSKGMRQKILLSAALLHDPELLILDEPLSGLDVNTALILRELVRGLAARGRMIFYSSHVLEVLEKVCTSVVILRKGHVVAQDSLDRLRELMHQPSLEGIFAQLTQEEDPPALAGRMKWLEETRGIKFELVRHFLARMLDGEWSSTPGQWQNVAIGAVALVLPAGMLLVKEGNLKPAGKQHALTMLAAPETLRAAALAGEVALLTLVIAFTGLLALIQWQSLFPGRRDYLALAGLPIRSRQIFAARFWSVLAFSTALAILMILATGGVAPAEFGGSSQKHPSFLISLGSQAAASGLGCFFILFAIVAVQGVLLNTVSAKQFVRISVYVQGALIGVLFLAGLYSWSIRDWPPETVAKLSEFAWAPPVWFTGLRQRLLGDPDPFFHAMASRAVTAVMAATILAILSYFVSYRRYRKLLVETPIQVQPPKKRQWRWLRLLTRDPQQEAVMEFMTKTLTRSRAQRVIWLAYLGAALGIVFNSSLIDGAFLSRSGGWSRAAKFAVLFWPLGTSVVLLAGFRHVLRIPAELPANWIFRALESQGRKQWMSAVERIVILYAVAPIYALLFPVAVRLLGWPLALRMTLLQALVSLTMFELLFFSWQQLPFTCSYTPGKRPLIAIVSGYLATLGVAVPALSMMIRAGSEFLALFPIYVALFGAAWIWARRRRQDGWGDVKLLYEDLPDSMPDLGIRELSWGSGDSRAESPQASRPDTGPSHQTDEKLWGRPPGLQPTPRSAESCAQSAGPGGPAQTRASAPPPPQVENMDTNEKKHTGRNEHVVQGENMFTTAIRLPGELLSELWQDLRYGLRMLAGSPGFTGVALISLSLGICVATTAFSDLSGFALRDVPVVANPDELVAFRAPASYPVYRRYRERSDLFSSTLAYIAPTPFGVWLDGRTERIWGHLVSSSYFSTLGVQPVLGRAFENDPEQPGQAPTVVVSYRFWEAHMGSDPSAIGKTLRINGRPAMVVGVAPKEFQGASPLVYGADLWMPIWVDPQVAPELADNALERRELMRFMVVGRLKPGVTLARAEAGLDGVARRLEQDYGEDDKTQKGRRLLLAPGGKLLPIRKEDLPFLTAYFTIMGGMVLLIACSNVANMLLARAAERRKEIAVRLALGASRGRLIRQLLTESLLVAIGAGVVGFLSASWLMRMSSQVKLPYPMPLTLNLEPDGRVLCFTLALTAFTGLAFGLLPALQATRADLTPALKGSGGVQLRTYRRFSLRNFLVLSQMAGSLTLLLVTGFLALGFQRTMGSDVGFDARNLYVISLDPIRDGFSKEQAMAFFPKMLDRVKLLPSVAAATLADSTPMATMGKPWAPFSTDGASAGDPRAIHAAPKFVVSKEYFDTIGIPVLRGRGFRKEDESSESRAIVVSERLAQECWKGQDPLGRLIELGYEEVPRFGIAGRTGPTGRTPGISGEKRRVLEVVGVVKNLRDGVVMMAKDAPPLIYLPMRPADYARPTLQGVTVLVRSTPGADALGALRREIAALDTRLTPFNARSMTEQIDQMMYPIRVSIWTYGFVGAFGMILASVGLAGVTAYSVAQRAREIGIRMALGAKPADVLGLVMKEGAALVTVGTTIGLAGAWAGHRLLSSFLSQIAKTTGSSVSDPLLVVGAPLLLAGLALVACYVPARKSMRVDPVIALRQE